MATIANLMKEADEEGIYDDVAWCSEHERYDTSEAHDLGLTVWEAWIETRERRVEERNRCT